MSQITIPDTVPYLLAILCLLLFWQLHRMRLQAGRTKAMDSWDRSGIKLFLHVTPDDSHACKACREANGMAFLPAVVASKKFRPMVKACTNPAGCRCLLAGLYGAWAEAERLQAELKMNDEGRVRLSQARLGSLIEGAQARRTGVTADQISLCILEAVRAEGATPDQAIDDYRFVIETATKERDLAFLVPAYLRLADLLEQRGRMSEAHDLVDQFFKAQGKMTPPHVPTEAQCSLMSLRKTRLMAALKKSGHATG